MTIIKPITTTFAAPRPRREVVEPVRKKLPLISQVANPNRSRLTPRGKKLRNAASMMTALALTYGAGEGHAVEKAVHGIETVISDSHERQTGSLFPSSTKDLHEGTAPGEYHLVPIPAEGVQELAQHDDPTHDPRLDAQHMTEYLHHVPVQGDLVPELNPPSTPSAPRAAAQ